MERLTDRQDVWRWRRQGGGSVGFVPTMGALHAGHLSLLRAAQAQSDRVIASIFVNPTQFAAHEDFDRYPRLPEADQVLLAEAGCDALFSPSVAEIYGEDPHTVVRVEPLGSDLCGRFRPGHFQGVATVVAILLNMLRPDRLFLGWKDYQQLIVLRKMVQDLAMPVEIVGVPTLREADGLAMSSRNRYLTPAQRQQAAGIHQALMAAHQAWQEGERGVESLLACARRVLARADIREIDYVEVRDADTLEPVPAMGRWEKQADPVMLIAVRLGAARLIDNRILSST
ncbi:MAG: pantoate--beta-alanine ligase [Magnetococcales bacterium]|nr:pantoate--beta-alanine ligase [Magnetococcales bacterium]